MQHASEWHFTTVRSPAPCGSHLRHRRVTGGGGGNINQSGFESHATVHGAFAHGYLSSDSHASVHKYLSSDSHASVHRLPIGADPNMERSLHQCGLKVPFRPRSAVRCTAPHLRCALAGREDHHFTESESPHHDTGDSDTSDTDQIRGVSTVHAAPATATIQIHHQTMMRTVIMMRMMLLMLAAHMTMTTTVSILVQVIVNELRVVHRIPHLCHCHFHQN